MTKKRFLLTILTLSFLTIVILSGMTLYQRHLDEELTAYAGSFCDALSAGRYEDASALCAPGVTVTPSPAPSSSSDEATRLLYEAHLSHFSIRADAPPARSGDTALQRIFLVAPSLADEEDAITLSMQAALERELKLAARSDLVYTKDLTFREDVLAQSYTTAVKELLTSPLQLAELAVNISYTLIDGEWRVTDCAALNTALSSYDFDALSKALFADACAGVQYVRKSYALPADCHEGMEPDVSCYFETTDPAEITALLETPYAVQLIDGRELYFHEDIDFIPGAPIRAYLDETILVIVWQEARYGCAETLSEIFLADSSQLCRKVVNDTYDANRYLHATQLAEEANAVLAIGGDLYDHPGRTNGIHVYEGEVRNFEQVTTDTCFFTADGEMLFGYRRQFADAKAAQDFVDEHNVRFSVCFGPVLIDDGVNVQPDTYIWGEINERYARGAIGKKDDGLHYLTLNMNQQGPSYWSLSLLSEETETMMSYGCTEAYALDGGQTCCTIIGGVLVNRVQFNEERDTSDIIFFATALPPK